jgi:hypothetical protein
MRKIIYLGMILILLSPFAVYAKPQQQETFTITCSVIDSNGLPVSVPELGVAIDFYSGYQVDDSCTNCSTFSMSVPVDPGGDTGCTIFPSSDLTFQGVSSSPSYYSLIGGYAGRAYRTAYWNSADFPAGAGDNWSVTFRYNPPPTPTPTHWEFGNGAFSAAEMENFFTEDGTDFIPNSGEWLTNITDFALSWLQTINQDDFLFFLMAFGLVNYIISWLWKQLSGASVMGEAQAWRDMFDDGEE